MDQREDKSFSEKAQEKGTQLKEDAKGGARRAEGAVRGHEGQQREHDPVEKGSRATVVGPGLAVSKGQGSSENYGRAKARTRIWFRSGLERGLG
jgi:hypothetical protein